MKCHSPSTRVTNSRPHKKRSSVWRRRQCTACGSTFTTTETVSVNDTLSVVDPHGDVLPFSAARLLISIAPLLSARTSAPEDAYWLAISTYEKALMQYEGSIGISDLSSLAFSSLERFDSAAALKYALDHGLTRMPSSRAKRPKF